MGLHIYVNGRRVARTMRFTPRVIAVGNIERESTDIFVGNAPDVESSSDVSVGKVTFLYATQNDIDAERVKLDEIEEGIAMFVCHYSSSSSLGSPSVP